MSNIGFPGLGLSFTINKTAFTVFGLRVQWYALIIVVGILAALVYFLRRGTRTEGFSEDDLLNICILVIPISIIGARAVYVLTSLEKYTNFWDAFKIWEGGLAIYGGIIGAVLTLMVFTKVRKVSFFSMADTGCIGLITGQIIGRWGNFFNCEAFGGYTDSLLAMRLKMSLVNPSMISQELLDHRIVENGVEYIQVHPTFLYESVWNLGVLAFLLWYRKRKKFDGEILWMYLLGYGLGRAWIEGLRTDQLLFFGTGIPVSQALSMVLVAAASAVIIWKRSKLKTGIKGE